MALLTAPPAAHRACADPLSDSFTTGGKRSTAHKPASNSKKKGGGAGGGKAGSKPAHRSSPSSKPRVSDDEFAEPAGAAADTERTAPPARDPPEEDRPRSRRAAESEEATAPAASSGRESRDRDEAAAEEKPRARKATAKPTVTKNGAGKRKSKAKRGDDSGEEGDAQGDGDAEGKEGDEQDDEAGSGAFTTLPSVLPRAFTVGLGGAIMGRSFQFAGGASQLQHESSFGRLGFVADLEAFPLLLLPGSWWRQIGLGASYGAESGQASVTDPATGMSVSTPVKQARWNVDVRAVLPLNERLVVVPRVGLQASSFTLSTKTPIMASACPSTTTTACLPDTDVKLLAIGGDLRIGVTADLGLSVGATYFVGLGVKNRPLNQIGYEIATSASGFGLDAGGSWRFASWGAVRALVPITRIGYLFHPSATTPATVDYRTATELVYGLSLGVVVFTN